MLRLAMRRAGAARASAVHVSAAKRSIASDSYHNYMSEVPVQQTANVDTIYRVKADQQDWNDTSQWVGYSDTYLGKVMRYVPTVEPGNVPLGYHTVLMDKIFGLVYNEYGTAAEILEELEADPLSPDFHHRVMEAQEAAAEFEDGIDKLYASLHPTYKTVADAYLARRHYTLQDWIKLVIKKRKEVLEKLSPEYLSKVSQMRGIAQSHVRSLERLGRAFDEDPAFHLQKAGLTDEEMEVMTYRVRLHKKVRRFGQAGTYADNNPL